MARSQFLRPCHHCGGSGREINPVVFGARMRARRQKAGISLRGLAQRMSFTPSYVSDLELGHRPWNTTAINRYEEALKA